MPESTVVAGRVPVRELIEQDPSRIEKVMLARPKGGRDGHHMDKGLEPIRKRAAAAGVPVQMVPARRLGAVAPGATHQGAVALVAPVTYLDADALLSQIAPDHVAVKELKPVVVVLDGIEDPHNYGAILRSAVAAGAVGALVPEKGMAPLSAVAVKASAGTALRIPIGRTPRLGETLYAARERGYWVLGLDGGDAEAGGPERVPVWDVDWDRPLLLVVGSEGRGMSRHVRAQCDAFVTIPMRGPAESLNASVAAGIALFAAARVRV